MQGGLRAGRRSPRRLAASVLLAVMSAPVSAGGVHSGDVCDSIVNVNGEALAGDTLTVVTLNMLHGFGSRVNDDTLEDRLVLLVNGIEALLPDVVILQEASITPRRHGDVAGRLRDMLNGRFAGRGVSSNSVVVMANGSPLIGFHEGSAILSRWRILSADVLAYRSQALFPPERRIALRARIATGPPGGLPGAALEIVGTHLTNTGARCGGRLRRALQAAELASCLAEGMADPSAIRVIGGDFNDVPGSDTIRALTEAGLRDAWVESRQGGPGLTSLEGHLRDTRASPGARIDYLFVGGARASVREARLFLDGPGLGGDGGALWASDHIGVSAVIRLR